MSRQTVFRTFLCSLFPMVALACALGVRPMMVMGQSMQPTLRSGQVALMDGRYYRTKPLACGDVVVFRHQGATYVKRVYAVAGETVTLIGIQGTFWPVPEPSLPRMQRAVQRFHTLKIHQIVVPAGHVYCLGDNIHNSLDSRELGSIPVMEILGHVQSLLGVPLPPVVEE